MAKNATKLSAPEHAEKVLHELEAKQADLTASRASDESEMASVSYEAHTGNEKAAAKLETLRERALRRDLELKNIASAVQVAKEKVALAQAEEAKAEQKRVALEVRGLLRSLRDAGKTCDEALETFAASSNVMKDIIQKMNALGFHHPSSTQYMSLGERAVRGMLVNSPFARGFESIAPREGRISTTSPANGLSRLSARSPLGLAKPNHTRRPSHDRRTYTQKSEGADATENHRSLRRGSRRRRAVSHRSLQTRRLRLQQH